jgi:hypothetical protein
MSSRKVNVFTGSVARHGIFSDLPSSFAMSATATCCIFVYFHCTFLEAIVHSIV